MYIATWGSKSPSHKTEKLVRMIKEIGFDLANAGTKSIKLPSVLKVKKGKKGIQYRK